ncbi:MAG: sporulation protein YabP [Clostridia bacterium]|nr:sporulation protein YabP [Clostridia bacterium]
MAEEKMITFPHNLTLEDRRKLVVSGVTDIGGYDEQTIVTQTERGELTVKGEGLHIIRMSVELGELAVEGNIISLQYSEIQQSGGFFSRLFK